MKVVVARLVWAVVIVWAVTTLTFVINNVLPTDPARMAAGPQARPADVERIRTQLGLDRPMSVQYARFMRRLVHFGPTETQADHATCGIAWRLHVDLGKSYQQRRPVTTILAERFPRTLLLAVAAVLVQVALGVAAGIAAALRKGSWVDAGLVALSLLGISAPTFILGLLLQFVLAKKLAVLPLDGFGKTTGEILVSLVLPALTLGLFGAAYYTRLVRSDMIEILKNDFVRTARAKGVPPWRIVLVHAFRNALVPLATVIGLDLGVLMGGAIVTESLFRWPGLGALSVTAMLDRDGPVILGAVLLTSTAIVLLNMAADLAGVALDPRIRARR